jgi:outer membrane protein OmpA-like peptidoglycan-associated protein
MLMKTTLALLILGGVCAAPAGAQTAPNPTQKTTVSREDVPVFRVTVVGRTTPAINYRHRGGATKVDFRGTALLPEAHGEAKVESKQGYIEIEVEFDELAAASKYGPEYLTYVMWAITPEGRATNLGEVLLNGSESKLNVTTELQAFGLIVTAEPYFAVTQPSDVVVMENVVRSDTRGAVEAVEAKYELLQRGTYLMSTDASRLPSRRKDGKLPLELAEARNAVYFARVAGADEYAAETFSKASDLLAKAEQDHAKDRGRKAVIAVSREAAQAAEDSRLISLQRREAELVARERQRTLDREAAARAGEASARAGEAEAVRRAQMESTQRVAADADRARAEAARLSAEQARAEAERTSQQLVRERAELESRAQQLARDRADADARAQEMARERAEVDARNQQLARERAEIDARNQQLAQERADAEARARQANDAAAKADRERAELREKLQQQLNVILETRESARGLIVNMSDVLFDTGSATLKPGAREKLARVAGVLLTYPELKIDIEGHTDSVGGDDYNQDLSERRADSVRAYLVRQGIPQQIVQAEGFGEAKPVASNTTAAGRQQNRRVELVISGESITTTTERRNRQ